MKNKRYRISLTPLGRFYFGGETAFSIGNDKWDCRNSSYIVRSACFPQQTSIVGMMRFLMLTSCPEVWDGTRIREGMKGRAEALIGKESFSVREKGTGASGGFGKLKGISACALQIRFPNSDRAELFYRSPSDYAFDVCFRSPDYVWESGSEQEVRLEKGVRINGLQRSKLPDLVGYKAKEGVKVWYIGKDKKFLQEDIFKEDTRIGIRRNVETGKTEKSAFYKQIFYRFADCIADGKATEGANRLAVSSRCDERGIVSFVFDALLEAGDYLPDEAIVELGGDSSQFRFRVEESEETDCPKLVFNPPFRFQTERVVTGCYSKAVLWSDAYLERPDCLFDISETKSFRFLKTSVQKTDGYHSFGTGENYPSKQEKYNLYERGSVFYFEDEEQQKQFETKMNEHPEFAEIGYNQYTIEKYGQDETERVQNGVADSAANEFACRRRSFERFFYCR